MRVPLAWKNLVHDRGRLLLAVLGIGFAVLLMCMQVGFRYALLDSTVALARSLKADLVLLNRLRYALPVRETFPKRRLLQAEGVFGVASADPFYLRVALWKNPDHPFRRPIRILACDARHDLLDIPELARHQDELREPGTALLDRKSNAESYGAPREELKTELAGRDVRVVGTFSLGKDFANEGNLLVSTESFRRYMAPVTTPLDPLDQVDLGLVRVSPGFTPENVKKALEAVLPKDVRVMTRDEFVNQEATFWLDATPIGTVFLIGVGIGFVVGVIICYQILHTQVSNHMKEFATLKAMGYRNSYFIKVVLQQSLILSILGFIPGALVSLWLYQQLASVTGLLLVLTPGRAGFVLLITAVMCFVSGCLAVRKVLSADPAELF